MSGESKYITEVADLWGRPKLAGHIMDANVALAFCSLLEEKVEQERERCAEIAYDHLTEGIGLPADAENVRERILAEPTKEKEST